MTWIQIPSTNLQYDTNAYDQLPQNRKEFWDKQNVTISDGIRTDNRNGNEYYMRIREVNDQTVIYHESELNKTYYDKWYKEFFPGYSYFITSDGYDLYTSNIRQFMVPYFIFLLESDYQFILESDDRLILEK